MPQRAKVHSPLGSIAESTRQTLSERYRGSRHERGYTSQWTRERNRYLNKHPLCVECQQEGQVTAATVVDHKIPHRGNQELFWDRSNWQSLCKPHHDRKTAREDGGFGNPRGTCSCIPPVVCPVCHPMLPRTRTSRGPVLA